jgi:uncharacterized protein YyaL (SSP411 family)
MPNRLAQSQSLYLRKHANNPIDWWPWCDEAIAHAREANKPIFLSIGYSSCHWCTVMEGEAFSNGAIAHFMNTNFVPIKVDREERPDIDSIYMQALQIMTGQGGWPLNIFLTPDELKPFYGGTYFPVEPRYGRPGFLQVLQALRQFYDDQKEKLTEVTSEVFNRLRRGSGLSTEGDLTLGVLRHGLDYSAGILTHRAPGPRFPMIPYALTALRHIRWQDDQPNYDAKTVCQQRAFDLALGGIYDHVGGGFHRYTVDPTWTVPHFEKMLYDNGQILEFLAEAIAAGIHDPAFERAIAGTVEWLQREMTAPEGYFYAAQDADSFTTPNQAEPEEGAFYVWRYEEVGDVMDLESLQDLQTQFTLTPEGNFEHGHNVLQRYQPGALSDRTEAALKALFVLRYGQTPEELSTFPPARNNQEAKETNWPGRIPAVTDTKMIVAWNSLMISGLARTATVLKRPADLTLAMQAAQFILAHQRGDGRFHRLNYEGQAAVVAQAEDYALFIKALLDLHQAAIALQALVPTPTLTPHTCLTEAIALQAEFDRFLGAELGGYYNTDERPDLLVRERGFDDNATPSANGVAIANLVRLTLLTEDLAYLDRAEAGLQSFAPMLIQMPQNCPSLLAALDWFTHPILVRTTQGAIAQLSEQYSPTVMWRIEENLPDGAAGLVCQGLSCLPTAHSWEQMQTQIQKSGVRAPATTA